LFARYKFISYLAHNAFYVNVPTPPDSPSLFADEEADECTPPPTPPPERDPDDPLCLSCCLALSSSGTVECPQCHGVICGPCATITSATMGECPVCLAGQWCVFFVFF
jgi:hypothetical protein